MPCRKCCCTFQTFKSVHCWDTSIAWPMIFSFIFVSLVWFAKPNETLFKCLFLVVEYSRGVMHVYPSGQTHSHTCRVFFLALLFTFLYHCHMQFIISLCIIQDFSWSACRSVRTHTVPDSKKMRLKPTFRRIWKSKYVLFRFAPFVLYILQWDVFFCSATTTTIAAAGFRPLPILPFFPFIISDVFSFFSSNLS